MWKKYTQNETTKINSSSKLCKTIYIMMLANYRYLERENDTAFKFHINNSSYFEMRAFLY